MKAPLVRIALGKIAIAVFLLMAQAPVSLAENPVTEEWVARYNRTISNAESASAMALDAFGNIYVTGQGSGDASGSEILTLKYNNAGNRLWAATYRGGDPGDYRARAIATDPSGNIYVAGASPSGSVLIKFDSAGTRLWAISSAAAFESLAVDSAGNAYAAGGLASDIAVIKYDRGGNLLWTATYDGPAKHIDAAAKVAVDAAGNVFVTGRSSDGGAAVFPPGNLHDVMVTIKFDSGGNRLWARVFDIGDTWDDVGVDLALAANGNVLVAGYSRYQSLRINDPYQSVMVTIMYDDQGNPIWSAIHPGSMTDFSLSVAVALDALGNAYAAGHTGSSPSGAADMVTIKYDNAGNPVWSALYDGPGHGDDRPVAIAVDRVGDVYVVGYAAGTSSGYDIVTIKYDDAGSRLRASIFAGADNGDDRPVALAIDSSGDVYVAGTSASDIALVKYNAGGDQTWVNRYMESSNSVETAVALAVEASGNMCVTGTSTGENSASDIVTIQYDADGNELWAALLAAGSGGAAGLGVDSGGNVYVAGTSQMSRNSIVVVKYGPSGSTIWEASYNGSGNANDVAVALAVDSHGNAYVTGVEWQAGESGQGIVTIKFDPSGNHLWSARTGGTFEEPSAIAVDATGNVYVAGHADGAGVRHAFAILKYDSAGSLAWIRHYGEEGSNATALALDDAGNVYGAGRYQTYERSYALTIKYDPSGNLLWASVLSSGGAVSGIAVDHSGNAYVTGAGASLGKYDPEGNWVWAVDGSIAIGPGSDKLALDSSGNIYVTGYSDGGGTGLEITTLKYDPDGNQLWAASYNGTGNGADTASALALDSSGNVYVTGGSLGQGTGSDFVTIKYSQDNSGSDVSSSGNGGGCFVTAILQ